MEYADIMIMALHKLVKVGFVYSKLGCFFQLGKPVWEGGRCYKTSIWAMIQYMLGLCVGCNFHIAIFKTYCNMYYNIFYKNIHDLSPFIDFRTNFKVEKTLIIRSIWSCIHQTQYKLWVHINNFCLFLSRKITFTAV